MRMTHTEGIMNIHHHLVGIKLSCISVLEGFFPPDLSQFTMPWANW